MDYKEVNKKLKHVPYNLDGILEELKANGGSGSGTVNSVKHRINQSNWVSENGKFSYTFQHNMFSDITSILMYATDGVQVEFSYTIVNNNTIKFTIAEAKTVDAIIVGIVPIANMTASNISILDVDNLYASADVEGALKEVGTKVKKGASSILNYCTPGEDGKIRNQDAQIQQCFNENKIVDLNGAILIIDSKITVPTERTIINGFIQKGNDAGHFDISGVCILENMIFYQTNFNISQALLYVSGSGNIKISRCTFTNSSIDLKHDKEHWHVSITDCNFDCDNTANASSTDGQPLHSLPQNTAIRAIMTSGRIVNLTVTDCRISAGRCFIAATTTKSLIITDNIIMGNKSTTSNALDIIHLNDVNSVVFTNNIIKEYITTASLLYATNGTRGVVSNNILKDCTAEQMIFLKDVQHMNVIGNQICKTIESYNYTKGILVSASSFCKIDNNNISNCNTNAIVIRDGCYHCSVSGNTLSFNNKSNSEWTPTLFIGACFCFTCINNYINIDVEQQIQNKPGFYCCDNNFGLVMGNHCRSYTDIGRNNDVACDNSANKWFV